MRNRAILTLLLVGLLVCHFSADTPQVQAEETSDAPADGPPKVEEPVAGVPPGSTTDTQTQEREKDSMRKSGEKHQFQAEVSRLMDIIINSLYSNKDVFLRELISNASDALDKIRFLSLTDPSVLGDGDASNLEIKITLDKEKNILIIRDKGIGMTKDDLIKNLGTIAKSGTSAFIEKMQTSGDLSLIGQFGVGFYSVYLVADYVEVHSKHNDDKQWVWASKADGNFDIYEDSEGEPLERGTELRIHLKDDATEYLEDDKMKDLVKRYSQFINFPIYLWTTKEVEVEVPDEEEEVETETEEEKKDEEKPEEDKETTDTDKKEETTEEEEEEEEEKKTVKEKRTDWELLNDVKAIWLRNPKDVEEKEYNEFYKSVSKDYGTDNPLQWTHFTAEGDVEFKAILYVPPRASSEMYENYYSTKAGLKLYVRRVFISDDFEDLLPKYLNFLKGLVDSDSLPLNVSREMLQQHGALKTIKKKLVRKALDMIKKMSEDDLKEREENKDSKEDTKYIKFWKEFGKALKLGVIEDSNNRMRLAKLLRIKTSKYKDEFTTLDDYIGRMKEGQKHIYYLTGSSIEQLEKSPFLEKLLKKGYEVVYLTDPVDEYLMQNLTEYEEKKFQNASKEDLKFGSKKDRSKDKQLKDSYKDLTSWWKKQLSSEVESVKVSDRLASTPCIVVTSKYGWSANMERIMTSQALGDASKQSYMKGKRILEINGRHPIIEELKDLYDKDPEEETTKDLAKILYDTALLESGFAPEDPKEFASRIYDTVRTSMGVDPNAEVEEEEEAPEEEASASDKKEEDEDEDEGPTFPGFDEMGKKGDDDEDEAKPGIDVEEVSEEEAEQLKDEL